VKLTRNSHGGHFVVLLLAMTLPASAGTLIETYGQFRSPKTSWIIDVSAYGMTFDLSSVNGGAITNIKDLPPEWEAHPGWFVFVENARYAWAYDGVDTVWVEEVTPKTINGYTFSPHRDLADTWGVIPQPPKEVFDRLPSKIQSAIRQKYPVDH
jgi:hypothetical protein